MLLRSSSAPIPTSWLPYSKESSPESEMILQLPRARSGLDLHCPTRSKKTNCIPHSDVRMNQGSTKISEFEDEEEEGLKQKTSPSIKELFWSSGLDKGVVVDDEDGGDAEKERKLQTLVMGGGGEGSDGRNRSGWDYSEGSNHGRDNTDAYYKKMIEANPDNALLLGNYAKFLKEVCGDYPKAEEYLERAILANPGDANVLSLYADLIWQTQKNADRAEGYFDQAVKSAPDDCYVLASYAKFLWDAEEEDEDEDEEKDKHPQHHSHTYQPDHLFHKADQPPRLPAAS